MTDSPRTAQGARESVGGCRGSAATVLFLLLFAGAVLADRREPIAPARLTARTVSSVAGIHALAATARVAQIGDAAPIDLRVTASRREIPRFLSVLDAGLPSPRAPTS